MIEIPVASLSKRCDKTALRQAGKDKALLKQGEKVGEPMFPIAAAAQSAIAQLQHAGYEAYLVGGCVRDLLLRRTPNDWDITTNATPAQLKTVFAHVRILETGLQHGTITVVFNGEALEITTYRTDGASSNHRHPDAVVFSKSLTEDLARRDFTMNAIAYTPAEGLVDCFGGVQDIRRGVLRCVGNATARFQEDALRILRALRFSSVLGFSIEAATADAIHQNKMLFSNLSAERIGAELTQLLCGASAAAVLQAYADVLCVLLPELAPLAHHRLTVWQHTLAVLQNAPPVPCLRWAALLHGIAKPACFPKDAAETELANNVMRRLKFDNATRTRVLLLLAHYNLPMPAEETVAKQLLSRFGADVLFDMIALARADSFGQACTAHGRQAELDALELLVRHAIETGACCSLHHLAVKGDDLLALGYCGKQIGTALSFLLDAVLDGRTANTKKELLAHLHAAKK